MHTGTDVNAAETRANLLSTAAQIDADKVAGAAPIELQHAARVAAKLDALHALPGTALFPTDDAAIYLNCRQDLLRMWRCKGRGPAFVGRGHYVRYRKGDLDAFINRHSASAA